MRNFKESGVQKNGKIYKISEKVSPSKLHPYCRCTIQRLKSLFAGEATEKGADGADWHLKYNGKLSEYYIDRLTARKLGWKKHHSDLSDVAPGSMLYGGVYQNKNSHLPEKMEEYGTRRILTMNPVLEIRKE